MTRWAGTLDPEQPLLPCLPTAYLPRPCLAGAQKPQRTGLPATSKPTVGPGPHRCGSPGPSCWGEHIASAALVTGGLPGPQRLHKPATPSAVPSSHASFTPVAQESHNCVSTTKTSPIARPLSLVEVASQPPRRTGRTVRRRPTEKLGADGQAARVPCRRPRGGSRVPRPAASARASATASGALPPSRTRRVVAEDAVAAPGRDAGGRCRTAPNPGPLSTQA